jgi:hypothetical protein
MTATVSPRLEAAAATAKRTLLSSAPSLGSIHAAVTDFYCGTQTRLEPAAPNEWNVIRVSDDKRLFGVFVRRLGNRYRFEME